MDDLNQNPFYHYLINNCRRQFEQAIFTKSILCVPKVKSINGIKLTSEFVDAHILKKNKGCYVSNNNIKFKLIKNNENQPTTTLLALESSPEHEVCVISFISAFYQDCNIRYTILIIDKPLQSIYKPNNYIKEIEEVQICTFNDARLFLSNICNINILLEKPSRTNSERQNIITYIKSIIIEKWKILVQLQPSEVQRNGHFQMLLSMSLENVIIDYYYNEIINTLVSSFYTKDYVFFEKCKMLSNLQVTADQFNAPDDLAIPLPAAIVELATLDEHRCPIEKINCLQSTYDLILAQIKGVIVEMASQLPESKIPSISVQILVSLLMYVIVHAKPLHLLANIYFIENFQWSLPSPRHDTFWVTLNAYKSAINNLIHLNINKLIPRSKRVLTAIGLNDLMQISCRINARFDRHGNRERSKENNNLTPLDFQHEKTVKMIETSLSQFL